MNDQKTAVAKRLNTLTQTKKEISTHREPAPWHAGHDRGEERVRDNHGEQNDREHPPQVFEVARADVVANRADDVIPGEDDEEEYKAEPERAGLFRFYVNDFGKKRFHSLRAVILSASEGSLLLA